MGWLGRISYRVWLSCSAGRDGRRTAVAMSVEKKKEKETSDVCYVQALILSSSSSILNCRSEYI